MANKFAENDIIPNKFAIKFDPPIIALEYIVRPLNTNYLLQINLEECFKNYDDPNDICNWIFQTYADVINKKYVSQKQILNLIQRILIMKRMKTKKKVFNENNSSQEIFEPDPYRKGEEKEFFKSKENFFKQEENFEEEINFKNKKNRSLSKSHEERYKNYSDDEIKKEIDDANKINKYTSYTNEDEKSSARFHENEFKVDNLAGYFSNNEKQTSDNFNFMDEISVESLHSDQEQDDKF
jgi:hypothetical protein